MSTGHVFLWSQTQLRTSSAEWNWHSRIWWRCWTQISQRLQDGLVWNWLVRECGVFRGSLVLTVLFSIIPEYSDTVMPKWDGQHANVLLLTPSKLLEPVAVRSNGIRRPLHPFLTQKLESSQSLRMRLYKLLWTAICDVTDWWISLWKYNKHLL